MVDVVTVGETMARFTTNRRGLMRHATSLDVGIAGAESNLAIGLARLDVEVSWIGRVGDDEFGSLITQTLRGEGIDTRATVDAQAPTGLLFKERRSATHQRVTYYRTGSAGSRIAPDDLNTRLIADATVLHLTGITPALSETARETCHTAIGVARDAGTVVSLDLNLRTQLWQNEAPEPVLASFVRQSDIVFATFDEARILVDTMSEVELAHGLAALGPREVVLKRGSDGAFALIDGEVIEAPVFHVPEIDPVGAGDAFAAGYLRELVHDGDVPRRLDTASRCGAFAVTVEGDWEGMPTSAELGHLGSSRDVHR